MPRGNAMQLPTGVPAILVAALVAVPVWFFDEFEALGMEFPAILLVFVATWLLPCVAILAWTAKRPRREALIAGALVAALMAYILFGIIARWGSDLFVIVVILSILFGSLAMGCAAIAGLLAAAVQTRRFKTPATAGAIGGIQGKGTANVADGGSAMGGPDVEGAGAGQAEGAAGNRGPGRRGKSTAVLAIVAGCLVLLSSMMFLTPGSLLLVVGVAGLLIGGGTYALVRKA